MQCPPSLEDGETLRSFNGTASGLPAGFFVGLNLDTSSPDTFRPPPAPIPFNVLFGRPQTPVDSLGTQGHKCDSAQQSIQSGDMTDTSGIDKRDISTACGHVAKSEGRTLADILLASPTKSDVEISRPCEFDELAAEEEDVCPICLEGKFVKFSIGLYALQICDEWSLLLIDELPLQNTMWRILKWSLIASMSFTCHAYLSGWREVIPAQFVIRSAFQV